MVDTFLTGASLDGVDSERLRRGISRSLAATILGLVPASTCLAESPQYFGFSWVHNASAASAPYSFTNIDVRPVYISDPVSGASDVSRSLYDSYRVSSVLGFDDFLYGEDNTTSSPRPDAIQRFDAWWEASSNQTAIKPPWVIAFWPANEALLRCAGAADVSHCLRPYFEFVGHIHDRVAGTGIVLVDTFDSTTVASGLLAQQADALVSAGMRWFGYHQYAVLHPLTDPTYQANVHTVREIADGYRSAGYGTRFFLVGDGFHGPSHVKPVGTTLVPWDWVDHRAVVDEDFQVACLNGAVALILFNWPNYSWLAEQNVVGSVSFEDPAACWEGCLGRFVKFGEPTCTLCGGMSAPVSCPGYPRLRRHLHRP